MMKMKKSALIDVFSGWMNKTMRDICDSMGNRLADSYSIALAQQTYSKWLGLKDRFDFAARGFIAPGSAGGVSGRPYKPTFAFAWDPKLEPR